MPRAADSVDFPYVDLKARILVVDTTQQTTHNYINTARSGSTKIQKCMTILSMTGIHIDVVQSQNYMNPPMSRPIDPCAKETTTCNILKEDDRYENSATAKTTQIGVTNCDTSCLNSMKGQLMLRSYSLLIMLMSEQDIDDDETVKYIRQILSTATIKTLIDVEDSGKLAKGDIFVDTINNFKRTLLPHGSKLTYCPGQSLYVYNRTNQSSSLLYESVDTTTLAALAYSLAIGLPVEKILLTLVCKAIYETSIAHKPLNIVKFVKNCGRVIYDKGCLIQLRELAIRSQQKVSLTTGCYDMCHAGHAAFLEDAKQQADILVVALNSDESVKLLKGTSRPIFNLKQRLTVLLSLKSVDFIVVFNEKRPSWVVDALDPDVFIKGYEYNEAALRKSYPSLRGIHITQKRYDIHTSSIIKAKL